MARSCRIMWQSHPAGGKGKIVSTDKRFAITATRKGFYVVDLDTYNENEKKTLRAAKQWACAAKRSHP